jgi:hypothetical protein
MKQIIPILLLTTFLLSGCTNKSHENADTKNSTTIKKEILPVSADEYKAKSTSTEISCKLTTLEIQKRRSTVIDSLKKQIIETIELQDGFAFKFEGSDKVVDELVEFIKTERECCNFFNFDLSVSGDKREAWLHITGVEGVKDFITAELDLH